VIQAILWFLRYTLHVAVGVVLGPSLFYGYQWLVILTWHNGHDPDEGLGPGLAAMASSPLVLLLLLISVVIGILVNIYRPQKKTVLWITGICYFAIPALFFLFAIFGENPAEIDEVAIVIAGYQPPLLVLAAALLFSGRKLLLRSDIWESPSA